MADKGPPATTTKRRLRLSKNKKKTWRKLSRDVDDLLPEQTKSELVKRRSGGFYIDVGEPGQRRRPRRQQQQEQQQQQPGAATAQVLSGLRCHESLGSSVVTPGAAATKRQKRYNDKPLERRAKRLSSAALSSAAAAAAAAVAAAPPASAMDLWAAGDTREEAADAADAETSRLLEHHMRCTHQAPVKRRFHGAAGQRSDSRPACLVPKCGASYNPSLAAHRALLDEVGSAEADRERREARLHGQLERHFPGTVGAAAAIDAAHVEEMTAGLFADDGEEEEEKEVKEVVEEAHAGSMAHPRPQQSGRPGGSRKQNAESRRQKAAAAEAKRRKRLTTDLGQLGAIGRQVSRGQLARQQVEAARQAKRQQRAAGTRRLGRQKFEELEDEFQLAEELAPSLRQLRPQGDLFVDAVKSYQRRGIVEPRSRISWRPKLPLKRFKKKGVEEAAAT